MKSYIGPIEKETEDNVFFRKVLFTSKNQQLVVMALKPGEEIGEEVHEHVDQFFRIETGKASFILDGKKSEAKAGDAVIVTAGTKHNVINSSKELLKLYTIYSPPNHAPGTVHTTKAEADAAEEHY